MSVDPLGLERLPVAPTNHPAYVPMTPVPGLAKAGAARDFLRNYQDMREANTIGGDRYFHCKANCEASKRGSEGQQTARLISDGREWVDQNVKGDPADASAADQVANHFGRDNASSAQSCRQVCAPFRPNGLPTQY